VTQAVILAGGKGTRLAERLDGRPKSLVEVAGKPLLARQIEHLIKFGVDDILLLVNYGAEHIARFVENPEKCRARIRLLDDGTPCGTAGAVLKAYDHLSDRFLVLYGDTLINVDLTAFMAAHGGSGADATLFLHPNDHPQDSDIVEIDGDGWIRRFHPYPHTADACLPNLVNAALYVLERRALTAYRDVSVPSDFGKDIFPAMIDAGANLLGYVSFEYIKDMGTPGRLERVEHDLRGGVVSRASLQATQKAVFVDRDGTLNVHRGFIRDPDQLELLPGVAEGIRRLREQEFRVVVVTNQPVVARGEASFAQLRQIHNKLETLLGRAGTFVDAIYVCPHHPDRGYPGEIAALKIDCDCRKPNTGLVMRAAKVMNIDLSHSWIIGDTQRDVLTGERAGLRSILVKTGETVKGIACGSRPDFVADNFAAAVNVIVGEPERSS
jgi:histidinol-phosphate phosphatase family protein